MNSKRICITAAATLTLAFAPVSTQIGQAAKPGGGGTSGYTVLLLDPQLPQAPNAILAMDVNDHNTVVGYTETASNEHQAMLWIVGDGKVTPFQLGNAMARGVNNDDVIVGLRGSGGRVRCCLLAQSTVRPVDLPLPDGHVRSDASKINDQGFAVGSSREFFFEQDADGTIHQRQVIHPVVWRIVAINNQRVGSKPLVLSALAPGEDAWAADVGQAEEIGNGIFTARVCGTAADSDGNLRAVTWEVVSYLDDQDVLQLGSVSGPTDLGALPGDSESYGDAINQRGDVAGSPGYRKLDSQPLEPLLPPSSIKQAGFSAIRGINDKAEVVGTYYYGFGYSAPVLWRADGSAIDLDQFVGGTGWGSFNNPQAVNNSGAIVGSGQRYSGGKRNPQLVNGCVHPAPQVKPCLISSDSIAEDVAIYLNHESISVIR